MKFVFFLVFLFISIYPLLYPQETFTALVTNPQIGSTKGEKFLTAVVESINTQKKVESVIILGDITFSGKTDEYLLAQSILNKLSVPFKVVGGPKDILLCEGVGTEYYNYWGKSDGILNAKFSKRVFVETISKKNFKKGNIPDEILNSSESLDLKEDIFLIFSYYPLNESIQNWFAYTNKFLGKKIVSISTSPSDNKNLGNFIKKINGISLAESKEWRYNIIAESSDSLRIFTIMEKNTSPILSNELAKNDLEEVGKIDSAQTLIYSNKVALNNVSSINRSTYSNAVYSDGKQFIASEDGRISCLNNSGKVVWEYNTNGSIYSSILKDRDLVISMTSEGDLFTINANNGDLVQVIGTGESISSDIRLTDLEYSGLQTKGIVFGTDYGNIYCYELYSLEMVWENNLTEEKIISNPLIVKDKIIYQDDAETFYCVNAINGLLIWYWKPVTKSTNLFFRSDMISDGKSFFITDSDGNLHSIDLLLGTETWKKQKLNASGRIITRNENGELFIHSIKNKILIANILDGKVKKEINLPAEIENSFPTCWNNKTNNVVVGFDNGFICNIDNNNNPEILLFTGNSPIISLIDKIGNEIIAINLNGKIIHFNLK